MAILDWFDVYQRDLPWRQTDNPYHIWVSEVMLQQTQVNTVIDYYHRFLSKFPTIYHLAESELDDLLKIWEGLGYYARARNLRKAAQVVVAEMDGRVPADYQFFRQLPGIGDYTAAAVQSIAFGHPFAAVDGNVKRVLSRLFRITEPVNAHKSQQIFQQQADQLLSVNRPGAYNQAMMELGATVCRPKSPCCTVCPVQDFCQAFEQAEQGLFPVRQAKKKIPQYRLICLVIVKDDAALATKSVLITRRPPDGLLGGLWEFPNRKIDPEMDRITACQQFAFEEPDLPWNPDLGTPTFLTQVKHTYTHFKIIVDVFLSYYQPCLTSIPKVLDPEVACYPSDKDRLLPEDTEPKAASLADWCMNESFRWVTIDQLDQFPFTGVANKFLPQVKQINTA